MKKIMLTPYPGWIVLAKDVKEFEREYKRRTGLACTVPSDVTGRCQPLSAPGYSDIYLVFAKNRFALIHELSHVVLKLFEHIGLDPRREGEEAFCYLIEHLSIEAAE